MSQFQQDNVRLNPGLSGANVATDYVSSKDSHYQIVKLDFGDENSFSQVSNQNPLPVNIQGINNAFQTLPVAGNTEVVLSWSQEPLGLQDPSPEINLELP